MKNIRTEYKILSVLLFFALVGVGLLAWQNGVFGQWNDQWNTSKLSTCTTTEKTGSIDYQDTSCTYQDEAGRSATISYPTFDSSAFVFNNLSSSLKKTAEERRDKTSYQKTEKGYELEKVYPMRYRVFTSGTTMSLVLTYGEQQFGNHAIDSYVTYLIDLTTNEIINQDTFQRENDLTSSFSSRLKVEIVSLYQKKFNYNYYQAGNVKKNEKIDEMIDNFTYRNLSNFYINSSGDICFILYLYNPTRFQKTPFFFKVGKNGKITYSEEMNV